MFDYPTLGDLSEEIFSFISTNATNTSASRGMNYYLNDRVRTWWVEDDTVFVIVNGRASYHATFRFFSDEEYGLEIEHDCDCPYDGPGLCKHKVAALHWIEQNADTVDRELFGDNEIGISESSSMAESRSADDPYEIPYFAKLTHKQLADLHFCDVPHSLQLMDYDIKVVKKNQNLVKATCAMGIWDRKGEKTRIGLDARKENDVDVLLVSCSCGGPVEKLCVHASLVLNELAMQGTLASLKPLTFEALDTMGQQAMTDYGLDKSNNWDKYFKLDFKNHKRQLVPKDRLFSPKELPEGTADSLFTTNIENTLAYSNHLIDENPYDVGFIFYFPLDLSGLSIEPVVAKRGRKNLAMEIGFKLLNQVGHSQNINYLPGAHDLIHLAQTINTIYYHQEETLFADLNKLQTAADKLASYPYLYISKSGNKYGFKKSDISPICFVPHPPEIIYQLEEKEGLIEINFYVIHNDKKLSLAHESVARAHLFFLKIEETLYFIHSRKASEHIRMIEGLNGKQMTLPAFKGFFDKFLSVGLKQNKLEHKNLNILSIKSEQLKSKQKELYLSELNNFVIFRPFIRNEDDSLIEILTEQSHWSMNDTNMTEKKVDAAAADDFLQQIRNLHPKFSNQKRTDFMYLTYEQLLGENTFIEIFRQLQQDNVKVFGINKLNKLGVYPYPGKVKYSVSSGIDWFEVEGNIAFGDETISLEQLKKRFVPGTEYIELSGGGKGMIPEEWLEKLEKLFRHGEVKKGKLQVSKKMFNLVDELFDKLDDKKALAYIKDKKAKLLDFDKIQKHQLPEGINAKLRHYQEDGFQWLSFLDELQWGGILADDMGLGKTLQVIAFLKWVLDKNKETNLVVVPTSLLYNWQIEIEKFAPGLKTLFYYGTGREKSTGQFADYHIVITTYGLMLSDIELLKDYRFNYIILDESQSIKNAASKRYKAARLLQGSNRLAMTGTPIENNTFDLFAQMSFLNPGLLGTAASFKKEYAKAIDKDRDTKRAQDLQKLIKPFVLRRTKEQVATELPDKIESVLYCEMGKNQQKVYDAFRNEYRNKVKNKMDKEGIDKARFSVLEGLTKLRQVCDSPEILSGDEKYTGESAKIDLLIEHIKEKTANHKILIFSQFVKMLKVIEAHITTEGISYEYLDGQSSTVARQQSVDRFQQDQDCRVFLISLKAGGTGLNLMAADYVYLVDPWWNPAVENQAIDRCYRIGQDKKVIAYRMICKGTVEDKILELQEKKKAIAGDIISTDENVLKKLDKEDILGLFG